MSPYLPPVGSKIRHENRVQARRWAFSRWMERKPMKLMPNSCAILSVVMAAAAILSGAVVSHTQVRPGPIPPPSHGQPPPTPPPKGAQGIPNAAISIEAALVNLDVLVTDEDGLVLTGLKKGNFRVLDDGKAQMISDFEATGASITIVMLMEYSGSAYDYFAYKAASWGSHFLNHLEQQDYVALVTYDIKPTVKVDFTRNKAAVQETLSMLSYPQFHEANMYDAIIDTLDRLERVKGKKAVLLISTGANTMSSSTLDDTLRRIKQSDVSIFSVGVAEAEYLRAETQFSGGASLSYLQAKNQLQTFAKLTGGTAWFPRFEGEIPGIFKSVATFLRSQYRIGFSPSNLAHDGRYHKLKVEIVRPDGTPLIVTNPKGKRQKPIVYAREGYTAPGRRTPEI
jgi:VWFA-related protein